MSRVCLGISGGVDSAVSAWMLQRDGHDVVAVTLRFCDLEAEQAKYRRAAEMCAKLGVEHHEVDVRDVYQHEVIDTFVKAHEQGLSPDPFALQNTRVVLPMLRKLAVEYGCDKIATGHYASITADSEGIDTLPLQLAVPLDKYHDQTYYLGALTQEDLASTIFPLWDTSKPVVHMLAMRAGLMIAQFEEHPQVSFLRGADKATWLEGPGNIQANEGDIVHVTTQTILGRHGGLHRYELGAQVSCDTSALPVDKKSKRTSAEAADGLYAVAKDTIGNRLLVGPRALLGTEQCMVRDVNWISVEAPEQKRSCRARYAADHKPVPVQVTPTKQGLLVTFNERAQDVMPDEPIVFYSDKLVLGGGRIVG